MYVVHISSLQTCFSLCVFFLFFSFVWLELVQVFFTSFSQREVHIFREVLPRCTCVCHCRFCSLHLLAKIFLPLFLFQRHWQEKHTCSFRAFSLLIVLPPSHHLTFCGFCHPGSSTFASTWGQEKEEAISSYSYLLQTTVLRRRKIQKWKAPVQKGVGKCKASFGRGGKIMEIITG